MCVVQRGARATQEEELRPGDPGTLQMFCYLGDFRALLSATSSGNSTQQAAANATQDVLRLPERVLKDDWTVPAPSLPQWRRGVQGAALAPPQLQVLASDIEREFVRSYCAPRGRGASS